jgi:cytochrome P450
VVQIDATEPLVLTGDTHEGCPVVRLETVMDRPVGQWMADINRLRDLAPVLWNESFGFWIVTRAALVREIFQSPEVFTNDSISPRTPEPSYKWIPSNINPPLHVQYRQILNYAFGPAAVARIAPNARRYCRMAVDEVVGRGGCDFVAEVAGLFPTRVFLELVDLPWQDAPLFVNWAETLFDNYFVGPEAEKAFTESRGYFSDLIIDRRRSPRPTGSDFTSHLLASSVDGQPMPDEDVLNIFNQLMLAGLDTVKSALSYSLLHLATHPDDRRRLVSDPELLPTAIEEVLRFFPLVLEGRKLGCDTDFHGVPMRKGDMVMLALPAVMHDPDFVERPDELLIDRAKNNHLSFGGGPHRCLGSHLARMEMAVGLEEWHRSIPDYQLACPVEEIIERGGQLSLRSLPLEWPVPA